MLLIVPETPLNVISNNIDASTTPEWSEGTAYTKGETALHTPTGSDWPHEFEAKQDHSGQTPVLRGSEYWIDLGASNQYRLFDGINNSRSVATAADGTIQVSINLPTRVQYIELLGLWNVASVTIEQVVDDVTVASQTDDLTHVFTPVGWWTHYFGDRTYKTSHAYRLYGVYPAQTITITLSGGGVGNAEIAQCLIGKAYDIGCTGDDARPRLQSFSSFQANDLGTIDYVERINTRQGSYTVWVDTSQIDRVFQIIERFEKKLVVLDSNNEQTNFDSIRAYGKITDFAPGIRYSKTAFDIKFEGLH